MISDHIDERWNRVAELFSAACDMDHESRRRFLDEACRDDSALRSEIERLLAADTRAGDFLEDRGATKDPTSVPPASPTPKVGKYTLLREIGSGGMGVVYEAVQDQTEQSVALKVMRPGIVAPAAMRRFQFESKVLGRLRHPGIAQVYEAGTYSAGPLSVPYFVMEYVPNACSITEYCDRRQLTTTQRLALFALVCDAVEHGHKKGIIHRDLKPGNILVDAEGIPKIIDFGIARSTEADVATMHTATGDIVGTLQYMSPEQVSGDPADLDTRTDVYSLGVVLYQLLTGALPYDATGTTLDEAVRTIREDPPRRFTRVERSRRGDPQTITFTALHKERERRYQSAAELVADVRRYMHGEPIRARMSRVYRWRKQLWRYKWPTAVALTLFIVLAGSALLLGKAERRLRHQNYIMAISLAQSAYKQHNIARMSQVLSDCPPSLRGWEWERLNYLADRSSHRIEAEQGSVLSVDFSPDGTRLLSGGSDGTLKIWDWQHGPLVHHLRPHDGPVLAATFSPDDFLTASGDAMGLVCVWDVLTGKLNYPCNRDHAGPVKSIAFDPHGQRFASCGSDALVRLWDTATGHVTQSLADVHNGVRVVAFDPTGRRIAWSGEHRPTITVAEADTLMRLVTFPSESNVNALRFNAQGNALMSVHPDGELRIWDADTGDQLGNELVHEQSAEALAISPDGVAVVTGGADGTIKLWDARARKEPVVLLGHTQAVRSLAIGPDGDWLASGSDDGTIRIWPMDSVPDTMLLHGTYHSVQGLQFNRDGSQLLCLCARSTVELFDARTGNVIRAFRGHSGRIGSATFSANGRYVITGEQDHTVRMWDTATGSEQGILCRHNGYVREVVYDAVRHRVLSYGSDNFIRVSDVTMRREIWRIPHACGGLPLLAISPDGQYVASARDNGMIVLWDADSGENLRSFTTHQGMVTWLGFDTGGRLFSGGHDQTIRAWDPMTGRAIWNQPGHTGVVSCGAPSPDGNRLVTGGHDGAVKLWNARNGEVLLTLHEGTAHILAVGFSPDGKTIASGDEAAVIRLWETEPPTATERKNRRIIQKAQHALEALRDTNPLGVDLIRRLERDETMIEDVRAVAIHLATIRDTEPFHLANEAWKIVELPGRPPEAYEKAYDMVRQACELAPDNTEFLNSLGAAEYRTGRFEAALSSLSAAVSERGEPQDYLFLAMTLARLNRPGEAIENLEKARRIMNVESERYRGHGWLSRLRRETEELIEGKVVESHAAN